MHISKKTKKVTITTACIFLFVILAVVMIRLVFFNESYGNVPAKTVIPTSANNQKEDTSENEALSEDEVMTSFIPLLPTETLMSTLTIDFDGDTLDDQIITIRKANSPFLFLVVGLYNSETNSYDRVSEIATEITKIRTFSYFGVDITGDHRTALVYQGVKNNGDSVLKIFHCRRRRNSAELITIGDFTSDGTIFILQNERSDAYELSQSKGASFPVWVYSSDKTDEQNHSTSSVSQIQTEFKWDEDAGRFVQTRQLRITGSRMAAKELSRILNGNVETFAKFLNGLWYKTTNSSSSPSYIYFNYESKEVIFLSEDTEGVYSWADSSLRRSGIYLIAVNSIISSMKRRFDIMLTGVNEVYVNVHDDVGMVIKESNQWNGTYKKMSFQSTFGETKKTYPHEEFQKTIESVKNWVDEDGRKFSFENNVLKITTPDYEETGLFVMDSVGDFPVIQLRGAAKSELSDSYAIKYETKEETVSSTRRGGKPTVKITQNKDVILLSPVSLSPTTCFASEGKMLTLKKDNTKTESK